VSAPRLASTILVGALLQRARDEGGFAAVLAKGDARAGSVVVILLERGVRAAILERILGPDGAYAWQDTSLEASDGEEEVKKFLTRRRKFDPDLWIIELDVPSAERFTAEMNAMN
jgi:hypothetical protein